MAQQRVILICDVRPDTARGWLSKAKAIGAATTEHAAMFTAVAGLIQKLADDTTTLDKMEAAVWNRAKDALATRNVALDAVKKSLRAFVFGLQALCDAAPDATHARALAAAAGVSVKRPTGRPRADFAGKAAGNGGVHLYARLPVKKGRAFWEWQMSTDGGTTWVTLATTNRADFVAQNLTPATLPSFRCRSTMKDVTSAWSQTIVVHVL